MPTIKELCHAALANAIAHGFAGREVNIPTALALVHSEVSEALECYREGEMEPATEDNGKPIGFASELADVVIRVFNLSAALDIDLEAAILAKMAYNATRPHRHGGKKI